MPAPSEDADAAAPTVIDAPPVIDSVTNYEKLHRIGEGTYGVVCRSRGSGRHPGGQGGPASTGLAPAPADKARDLRSGEIVALKKVRFDVSRDGVPVTSLREIRILQSCQHPNIVQLKKVVTGSKPDRCARGLGRP